MPNDSFAENPAMEPHAAAVSTGAQGLLAIARKRDPSGALALNAALGLSLQAVAELPRLCAAPGEALNALIGEDRLPETFFAFRAAFANAIDARAAQQPNTAPALIEMTHAVLLALGQSLGEAVRHPGEKVAPLGPELPTALRRLASTVPVDLQYSLVRHYVGNILQDFFDSCQVRLQVPELPWTTEQDLRDVDARTVADTVFRDVTRGSAPAEPAMLQERLRSAIIEYSHEQ